MHFGASKSGGLSSLLGELADRRRGCRAPSGPELLCLRSLSFGRRWAADFLLTGFERVSLGFEHISSMIVRLMWEAVA